MSQDTLIFVNRSEEQYRRPDGTRFTIQLPKLHRKYEPAWTDRTDDKDNRHYFNRLAFKLNSKAASGTLKSRHPERISHNPRER